MSIRTRFENEAKGSSEMAFLETNGAPYMSIRLMPFQRARVIS